MSGPVSEVKLNIETKTITNDLEEDIDEEEEVEEMDNITIDIDQEIYGAEEINENKEITSKLQSMVYSKIDVDLHFQDTTNNLNEYQEIPKMEEKIDKSLNLKKESLIKQLYSPKTPSTSRLYKNPSSNRLGNVFVSTDRSINIKNVSKQATDNRTILTKITEQFKDVLESNKKIQIYDYLVHDEYINRFAAKGKNDNWKKINNFINRNEEFKGKKQLKLYGKAEKNRQDFLKNCNAKTHKRELSKNETRTPKDFINDQIEYANKRESNLLELKNIHLEKFNQNVRNTPFITSRSKALAEKRNKSKEANPHNRLYSEKLNKSKTHLLVNENKKTLSKNKSVQELYPSSKNINSLKRTKSEILIKSEKLHSESKKKSIRIQENERIKILEVKKLEKEDFLSKPSKLLILKNFVKNYEASLVSIFNAKYSVYLTFEDFSKVLFDIHFTLNDPKDSSDNSENSLKKNEENKIIREAWKFITSNDESLETVDSNKILVFFCTVLGLYKGEKDETDKKESEYTVNKEAKSKIANNSKKRSPSKEISKIEEEDSNLLKNILHNVDIELYTYSRYFCENRINYIMDEKNRYYQTKQKINSEKGILSKPVISPTSINVAQQFRKKLIDKIESDTLTPNITKRKINLEEAYVIQRKKKENELAKKRQQKEEELMKKCTFQPNVHKRERSPSSNPNSSEITNKLYFDAFFRTNKKETLRNEESLKNEECTFSPKLNSYKSTIFANNPLQFDNFVKKNMEIKERLRIEKKICEVQKKKGINNLRNLKNIEEMLKEEFIPGFKFSLETKRDKDTFDSYKRSFNPTSTKPPNKAVSDTMKSSQFPLLYLDINIDNNKFEKMEIYEKDDPVALAESFATKYSLNEEKKLFLQKLIEEKMNENLLKR